MSNDITIAICIVDDSPIDAMINKIFVESFGYKVKITEHNNYFEFLEFLNENSKDVDLILLDVEMGDNINFIDKIKKIKSIAELAYVLVVTSSLKLEDYLDAELAGSNGNICKGKNTQKYLKGHLDIIYNKLKIRNLLLNKIIND